MTVHGTEEPRLTSMEPSHELVGRAQLWVKEGDHRKPGKRPMSLWVG